MQLQVFREMDADSSGALSVTEIQAALKKMGLRMSARQSTLVLQSFDANHDGSIQIDEFLNQVFCAGLRILQQKFTHACGEAGGFTGIDALDEEGKRQDTFGWHTFLAKMRGSAFGKMRSGIPATKVSDDELETVFQHIDSDRDGTVSSEEVSPAPCTSCLKSTRGCLNRARHCKLASHIQTSKKCLLTCACFQTPVQVQRFITEHISPGFSMLDHVMTHIRFAVRGIDNQDALRKVLMRHDSNNSRSLEAPEFALAMRELQASLNKVETRLCIAAMDTTGDGSVDIDAFLVRVAANGSSSPTPKSVSLFFPVRIRCTYKIAAMRNKVVPRLELMS